MSMISFFGVKYVGEEANEGNKTLSEASASDTKPLTYTKTDINRMSKDKLVEIAVENGIEDAHTMSGNLLKQALIEKLGV